MQQPEINPLYDGHLVRRAFSTCIFDGLEVRGSCPWYFRENEQLQFDHPVAVAKLVGFDPHALSHHEQKVTHVGVRVCGAAAEPVVFAGFVELVAAEVALVEVEVASVLQAKLRATSKHERQVGIAMAVAVGHAAAEECHR